MGAHDADPPAGTAKSAEDFYLDDFNWGHLRGSRREQGGRGEPDEGAHPSDTVFEGKERRLKQQDCVDLWTIHDILRWFADGSNRLLSHV